ncbi:hypothetical protein Tco_1323699, partial [Tanacetum coccineum]
IVIGDSEEVTRVLDIIKVSGLGLGLELNIKKTKIFWPSCNGMKLREGLFTVDIQRPSSGVKLLGGAVSRDTNFISGLTMRRAANALMRYALFVARHARIFAKKEAPVNFLTDPSDGRSILRPADVLVFGWVGGKHVCVDLTRVSPLVGLSSRGFIAGQVALKAASCKVTKHEKACIENQYVFILFAFDTFGFLAPEVVELLN